MNNKILTFQHIKSLRIYGFNISIIVYIVFLLPHLYTTGKLNKLLQLFSQKSYILQILLILLYKY